MNGLVEQPAGLYLDRPGKPFQRGYLRIALATLDPADLRGVDPAPFRNLFLRQPEPLTRLAQIGSQGTHLAIVCARD